MAESDLKADIAAAFDAAEKEATPQEPVQQQVDEPKEVVPDTAIAEGTPAPKVADRPRDEKGKYLPKSAAPAAKAPVEAPKEEAPKAQEPPKEATPPTPPVQETPKVRPPASWKPTAREGWEKVPAEIQQEVIRRERETAIALQESAEARQAYSRLKEVVTPYDSLFKAEGVEPIQGISNLMRTTAALMVGAPATKAQIVANVIRQYGVDIGMLDQALQGIQAPEGQQAYQPPPQPQQFRDPRVDALLAQQEAAISRQADEQVSEIEQEEFFWDVKDDMADILTLAAQRGLHMTAKDAYNRAVALHPEVSRVIEQRRAAANQNASTQRAMAASSSVRGQPAAAPAAPSSASLRDDLERAFDAASGRRG